jgi:hypothetical protein
MVYTTYKVDTVQYITFKQKIISTVALGSESICCNADFQELHVPTDSFTLRVQVL